MRTTDTRRVKDVATARVQPTLADFDGDPQLHALGYSGEANMYRLRINRSHELQMEGKGPLAGLQQRLAAMGYRSRWTPKLEPV